MGKVAPLLPLLPECFSTNVAVLSSLAAILWLHGGRSQLAVAEIEREKIEASHFGRSLSSRLFKHNKMYINSSSRQIRGNKGTYGGVVLGQRRNKSCSKCADTFPIVLSCYPHTYTYTWFSFCFSWWLVVHTWWGNPSLPLFCLFPMFRPNPPTLTWVPNCSLVGATTDLSPAFIQIYHN